MICRTTILLFLTASSFAAVPSSQPDGVPADQCADDAAFQALVQEVMSLRFASGRSVSELLAMVPDAERQLRQAVLESHQRSTPRQRIDGTIVVDAWLPTPLVIQIVQEITARYLPKAELPLLAVEVAAHPSVIATVRVYGDAQPAIASPGWRHCSAHQLTLARSAAEVDLRQHLLISLSRWRLSAYQTLGQLWVHRPDFHQAVRQQIETLPLGAPILEPAGLCRLPVEFGRDQIIRLLIRAAENCGTTIEADLSQAIDPDFQDPLVLDGFSVAPPFDLALALSPGSAEKSRPQWTNRFITTKQTGQPPSDVTDPKTRRAQAVTAARIEAKRQLCIQIEQLALPNGGTIGELLANCPEAPKAIAAIDAAILPVSEPTFDQTDTVSITLGIKLQIVWEIVRDLPARDYN